MDSRPDTNNPVPFRAETRQLLNILINSLYTEREVFLRELISNASDALTRLHFESLTNRDLLDPDAELAIWIKVDPDQKNIEIRDTGIGMNREECIDNLGTIAHSGARAFLQAAREGSQKLTDIIGQFGVGFYSAFMVAEKIEVLTRSYRPEDPAIRWVSEGEDTFTVEEAEKTDRGTRVKIYLKEDAFEYTEESRIRQAIKTHSDYIPYPIYLGDSTEPINRQTSIWRQPPHLVKEEEYNEFFRQFTLDFHEPLTRIHLSVDAPVQLYVLLFIPGSAERSFLALRKEEGLKLYARKVLIQEYSKDLIPQYFRFVDGVVDSEDIPLNISRESIQSSRVMAQIKRLLTNKIIDTLITLGKEKPEEYAKFWTAHGRSIREGVATDPDQSRLLQSLLRFHSLKHPDQWISLEDYLLEMPSVQTQIYYLLGNDEPALSISPHIEIIRKHGFDVLFLADPLDPFVLMRLTTFEGHDLVNAAGETVKLPGESKPDDQEDPSDKPDQHQSEELVARFKQILGDRISDVRTTHRLVESVARLVNPDGELKPEIQQVYRLLNQDFETPKQVLEINPTHPILVNLLRHASDSKMNRLAVELIYENALLLEGSHPNPINLTGRVQDLIALALDTPLEEENEHTENLDHPPDSP